MQLYQPQNLPLATRQHNKSIGDPKKSQLLVSKFLNSQIHYMRFYILLLPKIEKLSACVEISELPNSLQAFLGFVHLPLLVGYAHGPAIIFGCVHHLSLEEDLADGILATKMLQNATRD
jgi:hypothetical protein